MQVFVSEGNEVPDEIQEVPDKIQEVPDETPQEFEASAAESSMPFQAITFWIFGVSLFTSTRDPAMGFV